MPAGVFSNPIYALREVFASSPRPIKSGYDTDFTRVHHCLLHSVDVSVTHKLEQEVPKLPPPRYTHTHMRARCDSDKAVSGGLYVTGTVSSAR